MHCLIKLIKPTLLRISNIELQSGKIKKKRLFNAIDEMAKPNGHTILLLVLITVCLTRSD